MKNIFLMSVLFATGCASTHGNTKMNVRNPNSNSATQSWQCSAKSGLMGYRETIVRLEKATKGYSVFLTDASGDTGKQWQIKDSLVAEELDCKFATESSAPLYCITSKNGWTTLTAEDIQVISVDQTSGQEKLTQYTSIILSGTSAVLKPYKSSVLKFSATACTKN